MEAKAKTTDKTDGKFDLSGLLTELRAYVREAGAAMRAAGSATKRLIRAAIMSPEHFNEAVDALYEEIRQNKGGLAKACDAEKRDDGDGYVIPGSLRAQVSQVQRAIRYKVPLGTAAKPVSPTEMRKATVEAAEKAKAAEPPKVLTGDDAIRARISNALSDALGLVKTLDGDKLAKAQRLTADFCIRLITVSKGSDAETVKAQAEKLEKSAPAGATDAQKIADAANVPEKTPRVTVRRRKAKEEAASAATG
jgi:hypothetical protein